jgi:hypothetical protein
MAEDLYRVFCNTEGSNVYAWRTVPPDSCPNDFHHTIDNSSLLRLDRRFPPVDTRNTVVVSEEHIATQGNFRSESFHFDVTSNAAGGAAPQQFDIVIDHKLSLTALKFRTGETHRGDKMDTFVVPSGPVGMLTAPVQQGSCNVHVDISTLNYMNVGYICTVGGVELGEVRSMDKEGGVLTLEAPSPVTIPTAGNYVGLIVHPVKNYEFTEPGHQEIGSSVIGGASKPADAALRLRYKNMNGAAKVLVVTCEYIY